MTAFASDTLGGAFGELTCELRTVNHRFLDLGIRLPDELRALESDVRSRIGDRLARGKVDCSLRLRPNADPTGALTVNRPLAQSLVAAARDVAPDAVLNALDLLRWPGVLETRTVDPAELRQAALTLLDKVLRRLQDAREREGAALRDVCLARCLAANAQVEALRVKVPEIIARLRERLAQRSVELAPDLDESRLHQECALLAQKLDVDEELDRLALHLQEAERVLRQGGAIGRRLDFLLQEMHREANTIGSKSAHVDSTGASLELKVLVEQMREQVQNIE
ncbi:MAG: YicC family protein [Gammaproteobacteria bacterium]|nr:YicC family protein [Gammaproteobacteria bacterium]